MQRKVAVKSRSNETKNPTGSSSQDRKEQTTEGQSALKKAAPLVSAWTIKKTQAGVTAPRIKRRGQGMAFGGIAKKTAKTAQKSN